MRALMFRFAVLSVLAAVGWVAVRRWWREWGIDATEAMKALPGDDLVEAPTAVDTRGITIDAPPSAVWPWLVQMGYGRGGWYSYDQLDMKGRSTDRIVDEWQRITVGDIVPTHPDGGFEAKVVEPERALVLAADTALVARQAEAAKAKTTKEPIPPGLAASGAMLSMTPPDFSASWAFVLEPLDGGRTRLIERFRVWFGPAAPGFRFAGWALGFGAFVMMQRQMRTLRTRAEKLARERDEAPGPGAAPATPADATAPHTNGHAKELPEAEVVATAS